MAPLFSESSPTRQRLSEGEPALRYSQQALVVQRHYPLNIATRGTVWASHPSPESRNASISEAHYVPALQTPPLRWSSFGCSTPLLRITGTCRLSRHTEVMAPGSGARPKIQEGRGQGWNDHPHKYLKCATNGERNGTKEEEDKRYNPPTNKHLPSYSALPNCKVPKP